MTTSPLLSASNGVPLSSAPLMAQLQLPGQPDVVIEMRSEQTTTITQIATAVVRSQPQAKTGSSDPGREAPKRPANPRPGSATSASLREIISVPMSAITRPQLLPPLAPRAGGKPDEKENKQPATATQTASALPDAPAENLSVKLTRVTKRTLKKEESDSGFILDTPRENAAGSSKTSSPKKSSPRHPGSVLKPPAKQESPPSSPQVSPHRTDEGLGKGAKKKSVQLPDAPEGQQTPSSPKGPRVAFMTPHKGKKDHSKDSDNFMTIRRARAGASVVDLFAQAPPVSSNPQIIIGATTPEDPTKTVKKRNTSGGQVSEGDDYMNLIAFGRDKSDPYKATQPSVYDVIPKADYDQLVKLNEDLKKLEKISAVYQKTLQAPYSFWDKVVYRGSVIGLPIAFFANLSNIQLLQNVAQDYGFLNEYNITAAFCNSVVTVSTLFVTIFALKRGFGTINASIQQPIVEAEIGKLKEKIAEIHLRLEKANRARGFRLMDHIIKYTEYYKRQKDQIEFIKQKLISLGNDPKLLDERIGQANHLLDLLKQGFLHDWEKKILPEIEEQILLAIPDEAQRNKILEPLVAHIQVIIAGRTRTGDWKPRDSESRLETRDAWVNFVTLKTEIAEENQRIAEQLLKEGGNGSSPGNSGAGAAANGSNGSASSVATDQKAPARVEIVESKKAD